jgi:hypothetical protein
VSHEERNDSIIKISSPSSSASFVRIARTALCAKAQIQFKKSANSTVCPVNPHQIEYTPASWETLNYWLALTPCGRANNDQIDEKNEALF